jgi:hypothetical protein
MSYEKLVGSCKLGLSGLGFETLFSVWLVVIGSSVVSAFVCDNTLFSSLLVRKESNHTNTASGTTHRTIRRGIEKMKCCITLIRVG